MMSITRTEDAIEVSFDEDRRFTIGTGVLNGAMLAAERAPCGRIRHALILNGDACGSMRLEGSLAELGLVHQYVIESMLARSHAAA